MVGFFQIVLKKENIFLYGFLDSVIPILINSFFKQLLFSGVF